MCQNGKNAAEAPVLWMTLTFVTGKDAFLSATAVPAGTAESAYYIAMGILSVGLSVTTRYGFKAR